MISIDYKILSDALEYYKQFYCFIDANWTASKEAINATKSANLKDFDTHIGKLVGSGEQSFIDLMLDNKILPMTRYCCITPCFRDEPIIDEEKQHYFMKIELISCIYPNTILKNSTLKELDNMIGIACGFFAKYLPIKTIKTPEGTDIQSGSGIELGSYGIRSRLIKDKNIAWIYGTGCAEPRLSYAISKQ